MTQVKVKAKEGNMIVDFDNATVWKAERLELRDNDTVLYVFHNNQSVVTVKHKRKKINIKIIDVGLELTDFRTSGNGRGPKRIIMFPDERNQR